MEEKLRNLSSRALWRTLARVSVNSRDVGERLIALDVARPWRGHREAWCNRAAYFLSGTPLANAIKHAVIRHCVVPEDE